MADPLGAARPDFLDRALIVELEDIRPEQRRDERQFWNEFDEARPRIIGALLDSVVMGLRNLPNVSPERLPRMADFAIWATACEGAPASGSGQFLKLYDTNQAAGRHLTLVSSPLYEPLIKLARDGFSGSSADLLSRLNSMVEDTVRRSLFWPKAPHALGTALRRIAGNLRKVGIELEFGRPQHGGGRMVFVRSVACENAVTAVTAVTYAKQD